MADSIEDAIIEDEDVGQLGDSIPGMEPGSLPTAEELLKLLEGMDGLSEEEKETLRADLAKNMETGGSPFVTIPPQSFFSSQALILFALLAVIALIFGN